MLLILEAAGMIEVSNLAVTFHAQRHAVGEPVLHLPFGLERGDVAGIEIVDEDHWNFRRISRVGEEQVGVA